MKRLPLTNQYKRRKPKKSEIRSAQQLVTGISKLLAELLVAKPVKPVE